VVDSHTEDAWNEWKLEVNDLSKVEIPRFLKLNKNYIVQLHTFCDASELAYAAVTLK